MLEGRDGMFGGSGGSRFLEREDVAVRSTNDEATVGKWCAVAKGYYHDPFVDAFLAQGPPPQLHPPLMNRGHYARVQAIQRLCERFLGHVEGLPPRRQVVSLGCGFDTLYFRLAHEQPALLQGLESLRYFEVDFGQVVNRKRAVLQADPRLRQHAAQRDRYTLFECDLRDVAALSTALADHGFARDCPTLFLSECVLIYMTAEEGSAIISWAAASVPHSLFVTYEQIQPNDAFGKTMIRNLQARNIPLHSILRYPTLEDQQQRYLTAGYAASSAKTMYDVYNSFLADDRPRVEALEVFDEYEEWQLVLSHYCLVVSVKGDAIQGALRF